MFEKYGEFGSVEELNKAAAEQLAKGDTKAVIALAVENGIDKEDAEDYVDGCSQELATQLMAAVGKIELETKELKLDGILTDWKNIIVQQCTDDQEICRAVRKKGKALKFCMAKLIKFAFENKVQVSSEIVKVTKVMNNGKEVDMRSPLYFGFPSNAEAKRLIREYYLS